MTVASMNTNTAAVGAQSNVRKALSELEGSISRLSSGNAIDTASRDVSGLSLGTTLNQNIISLRAAYKNTAQATNVLRVAEGALKNVSDIIAKQKALAGQATVGSLDAATRGYLDQQFKGLQEQIDAIVTSTSFNGIKLLDGSLFAPSKIASNVAKETNRASGTLNITTAFATGDNGSVLNINGVNITLRNNASMASGVVELNLNVEANATAADQAAALKALIDNVLNYQGTNQNVLDAKTRLSEVEFSQSAATLTMTARAAGANGNKIQVGGVTGFATGVINVDGTAASSTVLDLATTSRGTFAANGAITSGQFDGMNASGTLNLTTAFTVANDAAGTIKLNGATITLQNTAGATTLLHMDIQVNTTASQQMRALRTIIENVRAYTGTDTTTLAAKAKFNELDFNWGDTSVKVISKADGTAGNSVQIGTTGLTDGVANVDGANAKNTSVNIATETRGTYITETLVKDGKVNGFRASGTLNIAAPFVAGDAADKLTINGAAFVIKNGAATADTLEIDVSAATTAALQAAEIKKVYDTVIAYSGTSTTMLAAQEKLRQVDLFVSGSEIRITAKNNDPATGAAIDGNAVTVALDDVTTAITFNGQSLDNNSYNLATATHGTFVHSTSRVRAIGVTGDSIIKDISTTNKYTTGMDASGISNNDKFVGTISGFQAARIADNVVNLSLKVGDYTYTASGVKTNPSADTMVTFKSDAGATDGGFFKLHMAAGKGSSVINNADASAFAKRLDAAMSKVEVFQDRDISSYTAAGTVVPAGSVTQSGDLAGTAFDFSSADFSAAQVEKIKISAPAEGQTNAVIEFVANGKSYRADDFGSSIAAYGRLNVARLDKANAMFQFTNGASTLELDTPEKAAAAQAAFENAFGIKNGGTGLNFQVGSNASESISVQLRAANTGELYKDDDGVAQTLNLTSEANAQAASNVLDNAAQSITSMLANVGAFQTRFESTANNLESSIQNQDAARSVYLDTDAAAESTKLAQEQTKLNAGISVLAQANQFAQMLARLFQ